MGVMVFNGIQSTLTARGRLLRASQLSQGLKIVVAVEHSSPWNKGDQCLQLQHLQQSLLSGGPLFSSSCPEVCARPGFDIPLEQNGAEGRNGFGSCYVSLHHSLELLKVASVPRKVFPLLQL